MSNTQINIQNLNFNYGNVEALKNVSFLIDSPSITALVGPNGAGKSTLMRCMAGLTKPSSGSVFISNVNVASEPREAHRYISYLSDDFGLYDDLSVREVLEYFAGCHLLSAEETDKRISDIAELLRITHKLSDKCSSLSRGWRQRAGIAVAIISEPKVLLLDEPASGLDPESRSELSGVLKTLHSRGMQILVSSHILSELEEYCDSMLVIRDGIVKKHVKLGSTSEQELVRAMITFARDLESAEMLLVEDMLKTASLKIISKRELECDVDNDPLNQHQLLKLFIEVSLPVNAFVVKKATLEKLYLDIATNEG